jgi:hypothetical protein
VDLIRIDLPSDAIALVDPNLIGRKAIACLPISGLWAPTVACHCWARTDGGITSIAVIANHPKSLPNWIVLNGFIRPPLSVVLEIARWRLLCIERSPAKLSGEQRESPNRTLEFCW